MTLFFRISLLSLCFATTNIAPACRKTCKKIGFRVERISSKRLNQHLHAARNTQKILEVQENIVQNTEAMSSNEQKYFSSLSCGQKFTLLMLMGGIVHTINLGTIELCKRLWNT